MKSNLVLDINNVEGFIGSKQPLRYLTDKNQDEQTLEDLAVAIPKLLLTNKIRHQIDKLPHDFFSHDLNKYSEVELRLLNVQFSFLAHAYVWGDLAPSKVLCKSIALPWSNISEKLGRPPILSYASYCLDNWHKINDDDGVNLNNVALNYNFLGGIDEDWFVTIHVCIEHAANLAIASAFNIALAYQQNTADEKTLLKELTNIKTSMLEVNHIFRKMPEKCDPYIYYHRVRPYIFGWKNNPSLPEGLVYEGCFDDKPQLYRGETGAQSSIVPALDALLSVVHEKDELREYLDEMKSYMPPSHRELIKSIEDHSQVKTDIKNNEELIALFDDCCQEISIFRSQHLQYAADYIHNQNTKNTLFGTGGSKVRGTGGTPFMKYLRKHRDETDLTKQKK
jgi:indoleamine 2,3-dioxygenase